MKFLKKYFELTLTYGTIEHGLITNAFSKADLVEGDEDNHREEVIAQAIDQSVIAVDDGEYVTDVKEITEEQYWTGLKAKNNE
jgi:hypothetical protein